MSQIYNSQSRKIHYEWAYVQSVNEAEFEKLIKQQLSNIFPQYHIFSFKFDLVDPDLSKRRPDLCMVKNDYSEWTIIEVELIRHKEEHIISQVTTFKNARYDPFEISKYMMTKCEEELSLPLIKDKLIEMISSVRPNILVVLDNEKEDIISKIKKAKIDVFIFQIYKGDTIWHLYRFMGKYPIIPQTVSPCKFHVKKRGLLEVLRPSQVDLPSDGEVDIVIEDKIFTFYIFPIRDKVYLKSSNDSVLTCTLNYNLIKDRNNQFFLKVY